MRSRRGVWGALFFLLAVPLAVVASIVFGAGEEIVVHLALGAGALLVALAAFDFHIPQWTCWTGRLSMAGLALVFLVQGVSEIMQVDWLTYVAYPLLGYWPEILCSHLFLVWLVALLLGDSHGKTQLFGIAAVAVMVCVTAYSDF